MKVWVLELGREIEGVFADRQTALDNIEGSDEDYTRLSNTEEVFETDVGYWYLTECEVIK